VPVAPASAPAVSVAPPGSQSRRGTPLIMPNQDLTIMEATVVRWLKRVGETVHKGQGVVEVETEKAVSQVESPADGRLAEILAPEGSVVLLGQQLATIQP